VYDNSSNEADDQLPLADRKISGLSDVGNISLNAVSDNFLFAN